MRTLEEILKESSSRHRHLCPRQVLGARMALYAAELLAIEVPSDDKRLLIIAETDGCTVDGLIGATGCRVGSRTLRILDFGKVAATFIDTSAETSIRIVPSTQARTLALAFTSSARNRWETMLFGYQVMPVEELFNVQQVQLDTPISQLLGRAGRKAICELCGEEIINGREVFNHETVLCRACAGDGYYHPSAFQYMPQRNRLPSR